MQLISSLSELQKYLEKKAQHARRVSFIPTMGALHEGHLSLVQEGKKHADDTLVSIFVNPAQFGPNEDFEAYPRDLDKDCAALRDTGADAVFLPSVSDIYPEDFATTVSVSGITDDLEGTYRPGHFNGVATVVTKLLLMTRADIALFGEKDYQQLLLIKRIVKDLNIPTEIIGVPTMRDKNGLALSSRNQYLSKDEYKIAIKLNKIMQDAAAGFKSGVSVESVQKDSATALKNAGFTKIDYIDIRDQDTFLPARNYQKKPDYRILAAAYINKTRLIDNMAV